jgi:hypothetical protein
MPDGSKPPNRWATLSAVCPDTLTTASCSATYTATAKLAKRDLIIWFRKPLYVTRRSSTAHNENTGAFFEQASVIVDVSLSPCQALSVCYESTLRCVEGVGIAVRASVVTVGARGVTERVTSQHCKGLIRVSKSPPLFINWPVITRPMWPNRMHVG